MKQIGKAYGFFDCKAARCVVSDELPNLCESAETPSELELSLIEDPALLWWNRRLVPFGDMPLLGIAHGAVRAKLKYVIEATCPSWTNRETANMVAALFSVAYQLSPLYDEGDLFRRIIAFKENGHYMYLNGL